MDPAVKESSMRRVPCRYSQSASSRGVLDGNNSDLYGLYTYPLTSIPLYFRIFRESSRHRGFRNGAHKPLPSNPISESNGPMNLHRLGTLLDNQFSLSAVRLQKSSALFIC